MMNSKKMINRLLWSSLALLGFSSCEDAGDAPAEYGTPYIKFQVKGQVLSEDGQPLQGIQVITAPWRSPLYGADTVYTDAKGNFESREQRVMNVDESKVYFHDVDGEANGGVFLSDSMAVATMDEEQLEKGGGGWYKGKYEYTLAEPAKLTKEEKEAE